MTEKIRYFYRGQIGTLNYCIIEHSGLDPFDLIESAVKNMGIIILGLDGDEIRGKLVQHFLTAFREKGINIELCAGRLWIAKDEALKFYKLDGSVVEGHEYIFSANLPSREIPTLRSPLKGWNKNILRNNFARSLEGILGDSDLYIHDDFKDCLCVSRSAATIITISENVESYQRKND